MTAAADPVLKRKLKEAELAGRRHERGTLQSELDRFIQTHEDPAIVKDRLEALGAEIARLEAELRQI